MSHSEGPLTIFKNTYSVALLIFSIVIVCALIFDEQTSLSQDVHPALAFVLLWVALLWLSMVEGGQASMVGLPPVDRTLYEKSHPITHAICEWGHRGDNLDRYLMGRQFMVLALVFVINLSGAPIEDAEVLNLPDILVKIFLGSGLAMILITCMIGQLNTQVNASHCMLDYINTHFMTFTLYVAMGIEASGLLHASYLIQIIVAKLAGKPLVSNEPPRDGFQNLLFWGRVLLSCFILVAAFTFTLGALFDGKTTMWEAIPPYVSVIRVAGMWNTGTNSLERTIEHNVISSPWERHHARMWVPWHKHLPYQSRHNQTAHHSPWPPQHTLPVVMVRDPYRWMQSMCKQSYEAKGLWKQSMRPGRCPNLVVTADDRSSDPTLANLSTYPVKADFYQVQTPVHVQSASLADLWTEWNRQYLETENPRLMIRFEDMLLHRDKVINAIRSCVGLPALSSYKFITKPAKNHGRSADFLSALSKYTRVEGRYTGLIDEDLAYTAKALDPVLMKVLGYPYGPIPEK